MDGHGLTTLTLVAARAVLADAAALGIDLDVTVAVRCGSRAGKGMVGSETEQFVVVRRQWGMVRVAGSARARASKLMTG